MPKNKKADVATLSANQQTEAVKDTTDTNRPQAEEKDLQDLLRDIEEQYEEEESRRKKARKRKNKRVDEADDAEADENKAADDDERPKSSKRSAKSKAKTANKIDKPDDTENKEPPKAAEVAPKPKPLAKAGKPKDVETEKPKEQKVAKMKDDMKKAAGDEKPKVADKEGETKTVDRSNKAATAKAAPAGGKTKKRPGGATAKQLEIIRQTLAKQRELEEQLAREEEERIKREEELERLREAQLEEERLRKQRKKEKEKARIQRKKELGLYLTKEQREKKRRALRQLEEAGLLPTVGETERKPLPTRKPKRQQQKKEEEEVKEDILQELDDKQSISVDGTISSDDGVKQCWEDETDDEVSPVTNRKDDQTKKVAEYEQSSDGYESSSSEYEEDSDDEAISSLPPEQRARARINRRRELALSRIDLDDLRCPVICVMGHVDTGKTKMLDNLRRTHVQDGEAGGITQQIGATNVPQETIAERTKNCYKGRIKVPGFLFIDTPGHESFKNLRVRGSSLCDIAILIVDLMHGIEPQTVESLSLLRSRRCPFVIALNKVDRLNGWKSSPGVPIEKLIAEGQPIHTRNEYERRYKQVIAELAQQKVNAALFYQNPDPRSFYPMVPVSAVTGDGVGDLMGVLVDVCQSALREKIAFCEDLKCTVMEVKAIEGFGTTIDICLVNGRLRVGDTIVVPGQDGPVVTQIRGLLMPAHNKDLRVKNQYQLYKEVKGTRGVKIAARGLERAMAGLPLYVAEKEDEVDVFQDELRAQLKSVLSSFATQDVGVYVQASTLGSLEALLAFLNASKIPFSGINIGPVHRSDITRASIMLEKDSQWAVILAFDVRVEKEAQEIADNIGVKIFTADIIYHLFDKFMAYRDELKAQNKEKHRHSAVFPCMLRILPQYIFNSRDPIVVGVNVDRGFVKVGTPLCVIKEGEEEPIDIGRVSSIEFNHKPIDTARSGEEVCIKIEAVPGEAPKMIGRHFEASDPLYSKISRDSIDVVKEHFRDEMQKADWQLIIDLKNKLKII